MRVYTVYSFNVLVYIVCGPLTGKIFGLHAAVGNFGVDLMLVGHERNYF